ncbi:MAG: TetR/AcrR family transcriptional regulator [Deltaproteobacteria bacterium]|nr:TetR/AcrR family transcriptional regulator [Deltaproteobacteria bacterium]
MGRPPKFGRRDIAGAALRLVAARGPAAATMSAIAQELGAPTGSIYHRFASRELLLAELWMEVVESFQGELATSLAEARDIDGAARAVRRMLGWVRAHPIEARLLLLHRREDFVPGDWPDALVERAAALEPQMGSALRRFCKRALGDAGEPSLARARFALLDAPIGGVKRYVQAGKQPPPMLDELLERTLRAVLGPAQRGAR